MKTDYWEGREDGRKVGWRQGLLTGAALGFILVLLIAQCAKLAG